MDLQTRQQVEERNAFIRGLGKAAQTGLLAFAKFCDPDYVVSPVHRYLAKKLEAVAEGRCRRLIITMPPRHGKSRLASVELPAWMFGRNPKLNVILASYASSLAATASKAVRDRITLKPAYRVTFQNTRVKRDDRSATDWRTEVDGNMLAAGVGGGITGRGADLIVLDDPFKDYEEAHSPTTREGVWNWFLSTLYTRQSPTCAIVIIMTRWHVDDIVGRLVHPDTQRAIMEAGGDYLPWEVVNLPALAEEGDALGRKQGEALFPERFPVGTLKAQMAVLGSYLSSALYQGHPVPKGGNYIDSRNFIMAAASEVPTLTQCRYWDLATSEKVMADYTAGARGGIDKLGNLWITDITRGQWAWPESRTRIKALGEAERGTALGVEAQGGFKTAVDNLKEVLPPDVFIRAYTVDKDKLTRALPWIALTEARKVFLVRGPWNEAFKKECEEFPLGKNDDQVDSVSGLYAMLKTSRGFMLA